MRAIIVIEVLPSLKFGIEIHIVRERQQLIRFGLISSVGTFGFPIQLWGLGLDIHTPHALVFDMPVKTSLKLMTPIGSDGADPEGKPFDHVVQELDRTILAMFRKDL